MIGRGCWWTRHPARRCVSTNPARFADLDAIAFTQLRADHAGDLPAYVEGSRSAERDRLLPVLGPDGNGVYPDTETFVTRLLGPDGAFAYLADFLTFRSSGGYKLSTRNVPATGQRRWAQFGNERFRLSAVPVNHGDVPAIAWRMDVGDHAIVFTGDFNNQKNLIPGFAKGADALVVSHAIPEIARGEARELYALPSQIGQVAEQADVRMVVLGHRTNRTRGRESQTREAIEQHYKGSLIFANDLECWGL
ncbi:MAG: MBL fold metallo-hydrolase [Pseudomonadales bacterium]